MHALIIKSFIIYHNNILISIRVFVFNVITHSSIQIVGSVAGRSICGG